MILTVLLHVPRLRKVHKRERWSLERTGRTWKESVVAYMNVLLPASVKNTDEKYQYTKTIGNPAVRS
jgi:hypothetical protein